MEDDEGRQGMTKIKTREFDPARYLKNEKMIAEYLAICLEDPNPGVFLAALGDVVKARGIAQIAKDSGLRRESLYKTFEPGKRPQYETIRKITGALGLHLSIAAPEEKLPARVKGRKAAAAI
jgi:probable addiction module antidote protein